MYKNACFYILFKLNSFPFVFLNSWEIYPHKLMRRKHRYFFNKLIYNYSSINGIQSFLSQFLKIVELEHLYPKSSENQRNFDQNSVTIFLESYGKRKLQS